MPTNEMTFNQVATILNNVQQQATGQTAIAATNTAEFVTAAQTTLKSGLDPVLNAINQVLTRTIFSVRPYERKFGIVEVSESAYGNHIRKLQIADNPIKEDDSYKWPVAYDATKTTNPLGNGESVDQYIINKPQTLQTNFYGSNVWSDYYTVFRKQMENAFTGPEQFAGFISMVVQNMSDKLEQVRENIGRSVVANFIGGVLSENQEGRVVHLLTEYNTATGLELTPITVMKPENYKAFVLWAYARIFTMSDLMTNRSQMYQTVVDSLPVMRHTPKRNQKMMILSQASNEMVTMAVSDTYHDRLLQMGAYENVDFWQSIKNPDTINVTPGRIGSNGSVVIGSEVNQAHVFGVIFDEEALGYATTQQWSAPTPFNARGGYSNMWQHETQRCWNDHSEKGIVLLMD